MKLKLMLVVLGLMLMATSVFALPVTILDTKLDGNSLVTVGPNNIESVEKDQTVTVTVRFRVDDNLTAPLRNVQVEAAIRGYDQNDLIEDITDAFDALPGRTYTKDLELKLPVRMDQGTYKLRIRIEDADGETTQVTYELEVEADNHAVWIKDILLNPTTVEAGRAVLATVRVENVGNKDENDGVKIEMSIPELDLGPVADYLDSLDEGESTTSEELFLRIPQCTEEGDYQVKVVVTFHDGDESAVAYKTLHVVSSDVCAAEAPEQPEGPEVTVSAAVQSQKVLIGGKGAIYPVTVANNGNSAKTFTVTPVVGDWGSALVSPSNILVVEPGQAKTAYVYVSANNDAEEGQNMFAVSVAENGNVVQEMTLIADLYKKQEAQQPAEQVKEDSNLKYTLEIVLLVILILLVLLGLIIAFKKLSGSNEKTEEDEESYY